VSMSDQSLSDLLVQHPTPGSGILAGQLARGLALREDAAKVTIYRLEFKASRMIRPGPTALRAGGGQLLIPSDPTIAPIGRVGHMVRIGAMSATYTEASCSRMAAVIASGLSASIVALGVPRNAGLRTRPADPQAVAFFAAGLTLERYVTGAPNPVKCSASCGRG
jgi:hypothetical protein